MTYTETGTPLKLAFVGGSMDSAVGNTHFIASRMDRCWDVVAGCFSTHASKNFHTGHLWGIEPSRIYPNAESLFDSEVGRIDAVVILTPTPDHSQKVVAALRRGLAVICEKALAATEAEISAIGEALCQHKGFLAVTYNYSGYPMVRELRYRIQQGELGRIRHVQMEMPQEGFQRLVADGSRPAPQAWRLEDGEIPTIHLDLGVHLHHLMLFLIGSKPVSVAATQDCYGWFEAAIDNVNFLMRCSDGVSCQGWYSKCALGYRNGLRVRIFGDHASAEWQQTEPETLTLSYRDGRITKVDRASESWIACQARYERFKAGHPAGFIEAFANLYRDIAESLRSYQVGEPVENEYVYGYDHASADLCFLRALTESANAKEWRGVPEGIVSSK